MKKTDLVKLRAQLKAAQKAKATELSGIIETIKVTNEIAKLKSPLYTERALVAQDLDTLEAYRKIIEEAYLADDRKMSLVFGFGIVPSKILAIMKSIQFSKMEEKHDFLAMTGLDEAVLEDTLAAFGSTSYFSKNEVAIVPEIPMDIKRVSELLDLVAKDMKLVAPLNLSMFNQNNVDYQYKRAAVRAEEMLNNTKEYIQTTVTYDE